MQEMTYSIEALKDMLTMGQDFKLNDTVSSMRSFSKKGYIIIIEQPYSNAAADTIARLNNSKEVDEWIKKNFPRFNFD
jgi:hypothetical protein